MIFLFPVGRICDRHPWRFLFCSSMVQQILFWALLTWSFLPTSNRVDWQRLKIDKETERNLLNLLHSSWDPGGKIEMTGVIKLPTQTSCTISLLRGKSLKITKDYLHCLIPSKWVIQRPLSNNFLTRKTSVEVTSTLAIVYNQNTMDVVNFSNRSPLFMPL